MRTLFPYRTLHGDVTLTLGDVTTNRQLARGALRELEFRSIDMSNLEKRSWETAEIPVELVGPPTELQEFRSDGSTPRAVVVVHCSYTNTRQAMDLGTSVDGSRWSGTIRLARPFWFGRVEVAAHITDTVSEVEHRLIGSADRWQILLDDLPQSPVRGALTVIWKKFDDKDVEPAFLHGFAGEPYYHFIDPDEPVLYLNSAFPGLEPLLRDRGRATGERALHDQVRASIATKFFVAAANAAMSTLVYEEGEPPQWPHSDWQADLLRIIFHHAFPKQSPEDALTEVLAMRAAEDGAGQVQAMLINAVDAHVGATRLLKLSIKSLGEDPDATREQDED